MNRNEVAGAMSVLPLLDSLAHQAGDHGILVLPLVLPLESLVEDLREIV